MNRSTRYFLSAAALLWACYAQAQQLLDDFNRANSGAVGGAWVEGGATASGSISGNTLRFNPASTTGRDWVMQNTSAWYGTTLSSNSCQLEWAFNMYHTRTDPSGLNNGNNGTVFILAGSNADPNLGQGYAVVHGNSGGIDPIRLVHYNGGIDNNGNVTNIISYSDFGNHYLDIRVTLDPGTNTWTMYVRNNGTGGPFGNPLTAATLAGTGVNNIYTAISLPYTGCIYNHSTSNSHHALFDNVYVPNNCTPTPPTLNFASASSSGLEAALGTYPITVSVAPTSPTPETVTVTLTNGPGAIYGAGNDYTTSQGGGSFVLNIPAGAPTVQFNMIVNDDAAVEATETITFDLSAPSVGLTLGASTQHVAYIYDDDSPPAVLGRGDLVVVGVNANNVAACGGTTGEDEISFFCFQDITANTTIDLTDNGYERCNAGQWADSEGTIRATRHGPTILAGTVITFRFSGSSYNSITPDGLWTFTSLNGAPSLGLNTGGDQLFFMQGGTWVNPGGTHDADYTGGQILYGFSSNNAFPWNATCPSPAGTQRSNLPLQMECFSMAPTSATDFAKYTGPTAATNQRGWIIRIGDPVNWTTYANCTLYNSSAPNYVGGYTFNFTTTGFTPGLWTGATDTDWFTCTNWDDAQVPDATVDVLVNSTALRDCDVDGGATAECASLTMTFNGFPRLLHIDNASTLNVYGATLVERTNAGFAGGIYLTNGATLNLQDLTLQGASANPHGTLISEDPTNTLLIDGDLTINVGGALDLQGVGVGGTMSLTGDYTNNYNQLAFSEQFSMVEMIGTTGQTIATSGFFELFGSLRINNTGGDVEIDAPVQVREELDLILGRITSTPSEKVSFLNTSFISNVSDASFVHGPAEKFGTTDFTFPIGKGNEYRPIAITGVVGAISNGFTAEYYYTDPTVPYGNLRDPTLHHVSHCEYWILERSSGAPTAFVTLGWRPSSCGVTLLSDLRIARWDGIGPGTWRDHAGTVNGGSTLATGTITTPLPVTTFSPFTLASTTFENPLPIELLHFTAAPNHDQVDLTWATATEQNNEYFTVERSVDGVEFQPIGQTAAIGNSSTVTEYADIDREPLAGRSYYRLRQTDFDGTSTLSDVVSVVFDKPSTELVITSDQGSIIAYHNVPPGGEYHLHTMDGRLVQKGRTEQENILELQLQHLPKGTYLLRLSNGGQVEIGRFIR